MRILIVDDDNKRSGALRLFLTEQHFDEELIEVCDSSDDAKSRLRHTYFDIMILDVVLPKRSDGLRAASVGLDLLEQLSRSPSLKKPEKIIGITAHTEDLGTFQKAFEKHCLVVIEAQRGRASWKQSIVRALGNTRSSKLSRATDTRAIAVITVHGIRTFGLWQSRLKTLIENQTDRVTFHTYRYGYFSALGLLIPPIRGLEVRRLVNRLKTLDIELTDEVYVFCHSFGTYLVARALQKVPTPLLRGKRITLVLSGSVLNSNFDWSALEKSVRIVNECGQSDHVLLLSAAFVPGLGMAGREGFHGFNNDRLINRFHQGGHSMYFEGDDFMTRFWLPLLSDAGLTLCSNERRARPPLNFLQRQIETAGRIVGLLSPLVVLGVAVIAVWWGISSS